MKTVPQKPGRLKEFDDPEPSARTSRRTADARTGRPVGAPTAAAGRYRAGEDTG